MPVPLAPTALPPLCCSDIINDAPPHPRPTSMRPLSPAPRRCVHCHVAFPSPLVRPLTPQDSCGEITSSTTEVDINLKLTNLCSALDTAVACLDVNAGWSIGGLFGWLFG